MTSRQELLHRWSEERPDGFLDLATAEYATPNSRVNVIGVIIDFMTPAKTRGTDWQMSCTVSDPGFGSNTSGTRLKVFKPSLDVMPQVKDEGDVIIVRDGQLKNIGGENIVVAYSTTHCTVFPHNSIPSPGAFDPFSGKCIPFVSYPAGQKPSHHEMLWAVSLKRQMGFNDSDRANGSHAHEVPKVDAGASDESKQKQSKETLNTATVKEPPQQQQPARDKRALISDVKANCFYDLVGQVIKLYHDTFGGYVEVYITDYTENPGLRDHAAEARDTAYSKPWQGPEGKRTLKIEAHPPHAFAATSTLKEGDVALLQNVRIKLARSGAELEGNMWPDRLHPQRVLVSKAVSTDERVQDIHKRKADVFMNTKDTTSKTSNKNSKQKRRRQAKQERQREANRQAAASKRKHDDETDDSVDDGADSETARHPIKRRNTASPPPKAILKFNTNTNIRVQHPSERLSTFSDIPNNPHRICRTSDGLEFVMPFVNCKHVVHLRVVDFYPHDLRAFATQTPSGEWTWNFWLTVVAGNPDESLRDKKTAEERAISIHVLGIEAQRLLGSPTPCDLHAESASPVLQSLEQRLFILWADLHEQKQAYFSAHPEVESDPEFSARAAGIKASSLPFLACVQEVGLPKFEGSWRMPEEERKERDVNDPGMGYVRSWRLFGTEIKSA
ncbi:MAG: hypothetical protein M1828_000181 [Chrysothrix sp. TS-e1954]|nr:MAG: hypothetical protein M1828_000181 [Chrysothrix sp. TS-e1954]